MRTPIKAACALCSLALLGARAEDIDIFTAGAGTAVRPNVLIVLDNSSNWSATLGINTCDASTTKFSAEICALSQLALGLDENVRLGLMMFAETGENGGYVRFGARDMNLQNRTALSSMVQNFVSQGTGSDNSGSNQPYGKAMYEVFKYFGGYTSPAHANDDVGGSPLDKTHFGTAALAGWTTDSGSDIGAKKRDYVGNSSGGPNQATGNRAAVKYGADNNAAFADQATKTYSPPGINACKNFVIFISNGNPSTGGDAGGTANAQQLLANIGGNVTQIPSNANPVHASLMDEYARFLNQADVGSMTGQQKVITYTIAVYQPAANGSISNSDQQMISLMKSAALAGGGKYFPATDASQVRQSILDILNEVQAVNSVFVSVSLPGSLNAQGAYLNQVYMGMFRPDSGASPRWLGNLKQYKIIQDTNGALFLSDSVDNPNAINPATGFISPAAKSFWSAASVQWVNNPSGTPVSSSDFPDGEVVEKGGSAQQSRVSYAAAQTSRRMYTCPATGCAAGALSMSFDSATVTGAAAQTAFKASSAAELALLVDWVRGADNVSGAPCNPAATGCTWTSAELGPGWTTTVKPSIHGDVLHSRPVVLNYPDRGPYVFYGANDGTLRGIKGGRLATDGRESWAFVAPEFYGKFKRLRDQTPDLFTPGTPAGLIPTPLRKDYFFDGPIGSYQTLDQATQYIFVTARRGGALIYAFDVSDPTAPKFMWKKSATDLPNLGQTWAEPKAFKVKAVADPVVMFGAGYDSGEDDSPATSSNVGQGVYVLNAKTGALIRFFQAAASGGSISKSVPSDVAVIDADSDSFIDRAYVGDTGGSVWRMDLDALNPANWKMFKLADLGSGIPAVPRKFFFRPDVLLSKGFTLLLIGTGDREKPLATTSADRFYMLKDSFTGKDATGMIALTDADLVASGPSVNAAKGWYLALNAAGEKVVNAPFTIGGVTYFATNKPTPTASGSCATSLGEARVYGLDFLTGAAGLDRNGDGVKDASDASVKLAGGGLAPSPVGGVVQLDNGLMVNFVIGGGGGAGQASALAPEKPAIVINPNRKKLFWDIKNDK
jgi:type IV pilus assembly protein PilY1